jgi:putative component of membrane protein insertase Oxa1/YidC/SpoIIIJ protein YidD
MAESMEGCRFVEPCSLYGCTYGELHEAFIKMVFSFDVLVRIPPVLVIGNQPLPAPFPGGIPVFPLQGTALS